MRKIAIVVAEGPTDVALLKRILTKSLNATIVSKVDQLPSDERQLVPTLTSPRSGGEIVRGLEMPDFFISEQCLWIVAKAGGTSKMNEELAARILDISNRNVAPHAIAQVADRDDSKSDSEAIKFPVSERAKAVISALPALSHPNVVVAGPPRRGTFILPGTPDQGQVLEDMLLNTLVERRGTRTAAAQKHVHDEAAALTEAERALFGELRKPAGQKKAALSCLAALAKPGSSTTVLIDNDPLECFDTVTFSKPPYSALVEFLTQLVA